MKKYLGILVLIVMISCSGASEWEGQWSATWSTDPAGFEGLEGITDYTMPGQIVFTGENVNIQAYGFEGCVFSKDTLNHSLKWKESNDSLILINDENTPGMVYTIKSKSKSKIELQLMEDIFLTLEK